MFRYQIACSITALVIGSTNAWADGHLLVVHESSQRLPNVEVDGRPAIIHTQGLYVTDRHFYVTGRLESPPARALLLRFEREPPHRYEYRDMTPQAPNGASARLDHPGGFDFDGTSFWIPIAVSAPTPPTAIMRVEVQPDAPLQRWRTRVAFYVADHIGALAWHAHEHRLYGANWDTRQVYAWSPSGELAARTQQSRPYWRLAIQDWKGATGTPWPRPGVIVAGGIDKSSGRAPDESPAVVEVLDPGRGHRLARVRLPTLPDHDGPVTHEGLALRGGRLYLLPGDLGRNAVVLGYRISVRLD